VQFFFKHEMPKTLALETRLLNSDGLTGVMETNFFND
jgi:hypothetical protein